MNNNYISGKTFIVTGAASGFGKLISEKAANLGAKVVCADINEDALAASVEEMVAAGAAASSYVVDVRDARAMSDLAAFAVDTYQSIDVMVNNAGIMPLAFFDDHAEALPRWHDCIDINIKGVLNGMVAVYDQMIAQGSGHMINMSSIYGNFPVAGAAVYGATKAAVNFMSESLRFESRGKIKVTRVKPTAVPMTGLGTTVVNPSALEGILGKDADEYMQKMMEVIEGGGNGHMVDPHSSEYAVMAAESIADQVIHAINQPAGVVIGDISIRATGDYYVL